VRLQNLTKKQFHEDLLGTSGADAICVSSKTMRGRKAWVVAGEGLLLLCAHHLLTRRGVGRDFDERNSSILEELILLNWVISVFLINQMTAWPALLSFLWQWDSISPLYLQLSFGGRQEGLL
jgi:hypothetical protein